jgi:hypothetical protein
MTTPPSFLNPSKSPPPPKSSWRPILITLCSALVLGAGSCFGFLNTTNASNLGGYANIAFAIGFVICLVVFLASIVWAFVTGIRNAARRG